MVLAETDTENGSVGLLRLIHLLRLLVIAGVSALDLPLGGC